MRRFLSGPQFRGLVPALIILAGLLLAGYAVLSRNPVPSPSSAPSRFDLPNPVTALKDSLKHISHTRGSGRAYADPVDQQTVDNAPAHAVLGTPTEITANGFTLNGQPMYLFGTLVAAAPDACRTRDGVAWDCARAAQMALARFLAEHRLVACVSEGTVLNGRLAVTCYQGTRDVASRALIRPGLALADHVRTSRYLMVQGMAESHNAGIWKGRFNAQRFAR